MFAKLTVPQLVKKLSERGASTRGRKADMLERYLIHIQDVVSECSLFIAHTRARSISFSLPIKKPLKLHHTQA